MNIPNISKFGSIIISLLEQGYELNIKMNLGSVYIEGTKNLETRIIQIHANGTIEEHVYVKTTVPLTKLKEMVVNGYFPEDHNLIRLVYGGDKVILMGRVIAIEPKNRTWEEAIDLLMYLIDLWGGNPEEYIVVVSKRVS